jgi:hypothetical protein
MKKLSFAVIALTVFFAAFFSGCDEETTPVGPNIQLFGGVYIDEDVTVEPGQEISFSWMGTKGDANLSSFTIQVNNLSVPGFPVTDIPNDNYMDSVSLEAQANEGAYEYLFILTDNDNLADSISLTITVEEVFDPITTHSNLTLQVASSNGNNTNNCASIDGSVFSYVQGTGDANLQAKADFVYYYTTKAIIAAPNAVASIINDGYSAWTTKNATKFYTVGVTAAEFDAMEDDELIIANVTGTSASTAEDLAVDDVVGFETSTGKLGLFKVTELDPGYSLDKYIKISIKVQQ